MEKTVNELIKEASEVARNKMNQLDAETLKALEALYKQALADIYLSIEAHADPDQRLNLNVLNALSEQLRDRLNALAVAQEELIEGELVNAAMLGISAMEVAPAIVSTATLTNVANDAVHFVQAVKANDGLILSERLWRLDQMAKENVIDQLQSSILQGHNASQAAQAFLEREIPIPKDIADKLDAVELNNLRARLGESLMTGSGSAYDNARRVFRTELNRAHGEAYQASAFEHPDAIGTRFLLSPHHPRVDICDMHARINKYGLGKGVYPKGKNPWPAHPNTLSYVEVVFNDEIDDDERYKEDPIEWLKIMPVVVQEGVLGKGKAELLRLGKLNEREINKPFRLLQRKMEQN